MVRRVVEEDVATPAVVHDDDGSWIGRTIVALVIIALLVAGAIWLVRALSHSDTDVNINNPTVNNSAPANPGGDNNSGNTQPSAVQPS